MVTGSDLLERQRELDHVSALVAAARRGSGVVVLIEGPGGIGKTGLLTAAAAQADAAGLLVLSARGSELERELPFGIVRQLFERLVTGAQPAVQLNGPSRQAAVLFEDTVLFEEAVVSPGSDPSFAVLHGLYWLLYDLSARQPVMLTVDDLQWADIPSLRWLVYLLPRLDGLRLALCAASRPPDYGDSNRYFVEVLSTDRATTVLRPAPLTEHAATTLLRNVLPETAEQTFCKACHTATGGNPLLLRELAGVVQAEGLIPNEAGIPRLWEIGARTLERRVGLRLEQLSPQATAFARAVAILGDDADLAPSTVLADLTTADALRAADSLSAADILAPGPPFRFVHPLVRSAVLDRLTATERIVGHRRAVEQLIDAAATPERVAAHLLLLPPAGDPHVVAVLRSAAMAALRRGSPENAIAYLERAISEPPPHADRSEILFELGRTALQVNVVSAAEYLGRALDTTEDIPKRSIIAQMLAGAFFLLYRHEEGIQILAQAINALGAGHEDLRYRLEAELLNVSGVGPTPVEERTEMLRRLRYQPGVGGVGRRMLGCMIACHRACEAEALDEVIAMARHALNDHVLIDQENGSNSFLCGCWALIAADCDDVIPLLDLSLAQAHNHGSIYAIAGATGWRAFARLCRGALTEAENDAREAMRAITAGRLEFGRPLTSSYLAHALLEQGRFAEAATVFDELTGISRPLVVSSYWVMHARSCLLLATGEVNAALDVALACHGLTDYAKNPALIPWRSQAALCLRELSRPDEARNYAEEELGLARQWGAPRALGRALRVTALAKGDRALMEESVNVLEKSSARLEYAKSLLELGAMLRRERQAAPARELLLQALGQAMRCGADPLADRARTELRAAGARPRTMALLTGVEALTPSERRIAELAAKHVSNREIAQTLFVTPKTVERHLTSTYRKLGVVKRADLATALAATDGG